MERKNFNCYACQKNNNFYIEINKIGNCCKYCGTYNYFKIKKNRNINNLHNNNQIKNNIEEREIIHQNSLINSINNNIYSNIIDENCPLISNNIQNNTIINNYNNTNLVYDYNFQLLNINDNSIFCNCNNKENENDLIGNKYKWLKKINATKDILDKNGKDFICSICYEKFKEKDYIHITKCDHIFHYLCIEKAIDNNLYDCPLCRTNIKNGKKKNTNEISNNFNNNIENNNRYIYIDNNILNFENENLLINEINIQNNHNKCISLKNIIFCFLLLIMIVFGIIIFNKNKKILFFTSLIIHIIKKYFSSKIRFIIIFIFLISIVIFIKMKLKIN